MQVVAHNLLAQFTDRQLNITNKNKEKSTEKLSSGYRINRSADDAAGLQISEKLRWQIRGLDRGAKNIEDGIAMVQTADGAMSEMHSILQRVRELSIQAYNDSNTTEDREAIQDEVDQSLTELQRIAETTTFNTKPLLGGNPVTIVKITPDQKVKVRQTEVRSVPDWLYNNMDHELTVHAGYTQGGQEKENMLVTKSDKDPTPDKYYGARNPSLEALGYRHEKEWTDTIADNPSARIDFSGLISASTTAVDLYNNIFDLIGSKISFGCGTCSSILNSITFGGNESALEIVGFDKTPGVMEEVYGNVNLSDLGYFDAIKELLNKYGEDYDKGQGGSAAEQAEVKALAEKIAGGLRDAVANTWQQTMGGHFDRVMKQNGNDYALYVYDYRDADALIHSEDADTAIKTSATVTYLVDSDMVQKGQTMAVVSPVMIECGALSPNAIPIDFPNVTLSALGISDYKINRYQEIQTYSDSYKQKWQEYYDTKQVSTTTVTETERYIKKPGKAPVYATYKTYVNGEEKQNTVQVQPGEAAEYGTRTVTSTRTKITYDESKRPVAQAGDIQKHSIYDPDPVEMIDGAIAKVSAARSRMGAIQNRLEHAYKMNTNTSENTGSAESRLRDTDMADEMVNYAKHNILQQAGQNMLAQANQQPQQVLSLLQ